MSSRVLLLAMCLTATAPATARELPVTHLPAEALALLLLDEDATFDAGQINYGFGNPALRGFDMRGDDAPIDVAGFEAMAQPRMPLAMRPVEAIDEASFQRAGEMLPLPGWHRAGGTEFIATATGRHALNDMRFRMPRRGPRPLDGRLTLRIDGKDETPSLSIRGGVAGAVWTAVATN